MLLGRIGVHMKFRPPLKEMAGVHRRFRILFIAGLNERIGYFYPFLIAIPSSTHSFVLFVVFFIFVSLFFVDG